MLILILHNINKLFETKKHFMEQFSSLLENGSLPDLTIPLKENEIHYLPELERKYKDISKASLYRIVKGQRVRHRMVFSVRKTVEKMILAKQQQIKDDLEMSAKLNAIS